MNFLRWLLWHLRVAWWNTRWYLGLLVFLSVESWRYCAWLMAEWWREPRFRWLVQGLPALLLGTGAVIMAVSLAVTSPLRALDDYAREAARSYEDKDYETARICYERLVLLTEGKLEYRYGLAKTALAVHDRARAAALASSLAPPDRQGYGPAHLLQAQELLKEAESFAAFHTAELHLLRAVQALPEDMEARTLEMEARTLLGQLLLASGRLDQAEPHLALAVKTRPENVLPLTQAYLRQGKVDDARRLVEQALPAFRKEAEADPENHQARVRWAMCTVVLGDFPGAIRILQPGLATSSGAIYRQALAQVHSQWAEILERHGKTSPADHLRVLEQGLRYDPENLTMLRGLVVLAQGTDAPSGQARALVSAFLAKGQALAGLHMLMGVEAMERGQSGDARQHLEEARKHSPQSPLVANNLAWVLAQGEPAELTRALELADFAVARLPLEPAFHGTRGQILAKLGRWQDALPDLQAALRGSPRYRGLHHKTLAQAYEHLGLSKMAAEHQRLAEAGEQAPTQAPSSPKK